MSTKYVRVVKRGKKIDYVNLYNFLSFECSSRCLDDEDDTDAVVKALLNKFKIYNKDLVRVERRDN